MEVSTGSWRARNGRRWWQSTITKVLGIVALLAAGPTAGYFTGGAGAQEKVDSTAAAVEKRLTAGIAKVEAGIRRDMVRVEDRVQSNVDTISQTQSALSAVTALQEAAKDERKDIRADVKEVMKAINNLTTLVQLAINGDSAAGHP